ncbi:MAG TPA: serine/threonine-protein kinase [Ktedonobacteraceae bacterium]|nr:serine/threonine-protein kinase [Ktedonobacteraceae bacterium]
MPATYNQGSKLDHYEIIRMLGHGGMNHVYRARDLRNQQEVVLKIPNDDLIGNVAVFERYKREAAIGSRLQHPHIQQLLNTDEERNSHYLVVEFIKGRTLREILDDHPHEPLLQEEALRIIRQVCEALAYAHEHGVFHRDIKPENIMITESGDIKIIDFGIALLEGARRVTWRGLSGTVGTPDYMSPEQLRGERGTAASDIYAVGIVLYEMLCGHTPFESENIFAVMNQHISQDPPSILQFNPHISPALATVVMRAVRRDPLKRYKSMREMLHDLEHLEDVAATPYKPDAPVSSRNRRIIIQSTVAILIFFSIATAIGLLLQYLHHAAH